MIPISSPPTLNPKPTSSFKNPGEWEVFNKIKELPNTALNANFSVSSKNHRGPPPMSIEFSAYPFVVKSKNLLQKHTPEIFIIYTNLKPNQELC
jgi:hypothetical protein